MEDSQKCNQKDMDNRFAALPIKILLDRRITLIQLKVYAAILSFKKTGKDYAYPSRAAIGARCGYAKSTISSATAGLEKIGWIKKAPRANSNTSVYTFLIPDFDESFAKSDKFDVLESGRRMALANKSTTALGSQEEGSSGIKDNGASGEQHRKQPTEQPTEQPASFGSASEPSASHDEEDLEKEEKMICPHKKILDIYHESLPNNPRMLSWTEKRKKTLKARWREKPDLEWWAGFMEFISESDFLTGKVVQHDRKQFLPNLEWIINPNNFAKIREGKYHSQG